MLRIFANQGEWSHFYVIFCGTGTIFILFYEMKAISRALKWRKVYLSRCFTFGDMAVQTWQVMLISQKFVNPYLKN